MSDQHIDSFIWTGVFGYDITRWNLPGPWKGKWMRQTDLPGVKDAQVTGSTWSRIATPPLRTTRGRRGVFFENLARLTKHLESDPDVVVVDSAASYRAARQAGEHAAFLAIQRANALDYDVTDIDRLAAVKITRSTPQGLTHLRLGEAAHTIPSWPPRPDTALTDLGREFVARLNARRVFVEAHISRAGFWEALDAHARDLPLLVTHAAAGRVFPHSRNPDDRQLKALADRGGVVGTIMKSPLLGPAPTAIAVVNHLGHMANVAPLDLRFPERLPWLAEVLLKRGWPESRVQRLLGAPISSRSSPGRKVMTGVFFPK